MNRFLFFKGKPDVVGRFTDRYTNITDMLDRDIFIKKVKGLLNRWFIDSPRKRQKFLKTHFNDCDEAAVEFIYEERENWVNKRIQHTIQLLFG